MIQNFEDFSCADSCCCDLRSDLWNLLFTDEANQSGIKREVIHKNPGIGFVHFTCPIPGFVSVVCLAVLRFPGKGIQLTAGIGRTEFCFGEQVARAAGIEVNMLSTATKNHKSTLYFYIDEVELDFLERKTFQETVRNPVIDKHYLKCYDYPINSKERSELHAVPE